MDLYFAPLACSLAARIALYEAGLQAGFRQVTLSTKRLADDADYWPVNPKGQVPALTLPDGGILTEVPAVLQYIADLDPQGRLAPAQGMPERYRLQEWLNFVATELHKGVFYLLFNPATPPEAKAFVRETVLPPRYRHLSRHLAERAFLLQDFSVADAYLLTSLNWTLATGLLADWPVLATYRERLLERPAVARAVADEMALRDAA